MDLGLHGIRYDRIFAIFNAETLHFCSMATTGEVTILKQEIVETNDSKTLVITSTEPGALIKAGLPTSISLDMDKVHRGEYMRCWKNFNGFKQKEEFNQWLTVVFGYEVFLARSADDRLTKLNTYLPFQ